MGKILRNIAVDLTPILPGGVNGGAKIFVIELISRLAAAEPQCQFTLMTQNSSHEELAILDRPNVKRQCVLGDTTRSALRLQLKLVAVRFTQRLPGRVQRLLGRIGYKLNAMNKSSSADRKLLNKMGIDLLFCPFTAPTYVEMGVPTVCTIYDLQYKSYPEFFSPLEVVHRHGTFVAACRKANALTAISDYSRERAIHYGKLDPARIKTIYLRMSQRINNLRTGGSPVHERLGLVTEQYLIYPANFWEHKNHEMLLTAFGIACAEGLPTTVKLVCTGAPGKRMDWLKVAAQKLGIADRVVFPGYLSDEELAALLAACRGMVFPSLYEGFGLPIVEAMAAGVPVACSNSTSLPEVAAGAALLFDPRIPVQIADAIMTLCTNVSLCQQLVAKGSVRAQELADTDRMATEYWELFQSTLLGEKLTNIVFGLHDDGWASSKLDVQVATSTGQLLLELDLFLPDWVPFENQRIQIFSDGRALGKPVKLKRAGRVTLRQPLSSNGGRYEIKLAPTFVPALTGHGGDGRELSAMVSRCVIAGNNVTIDLRTPKAAA